MIKFVTEGTLVVGSKAHIPAFEALRSTTAAKHLDVSQFTKELVFTVDFVNTVQIVKGTKYNSDIFQRPVQWILTSTGKSDSGIVQHMLIISPYEAQNFMSAINSSETTTLHLYAPRTTTLSHKALDALDLFNVPNRYVTIPRCFILLLNSFAGQLYLSSYTEYTEVCELLGLSFQPSDNQTVVAADGFILEKNGRPGTSSFKKSPVNFLRDLKNKVRRNCESIEKTDLGKILDGTLLTKEDFESEEAK